MCLTKVLKPKKDSGIGYKLVNKTGVEGVFRPEWPYAYKRGGCWGLNPEELKGSKKKAVKIETIYTFNKTTTVPARRIAITADGREKYRAGIHLYLGIPNHDYYHHSLLTCIKCSYTKALATDGHTVVARSITPLSIVEIKEAARWAYQKDRYS